MSMLSNLELIRRIPLFALLPAAQAEAVAQAVTKRRVRRGEVVLAQGERCTHLYILLTGRVRLVSTDPRGREVILATLHPGDYLGEMGLIDNQAQSAAARADRPTDLLALARADFARCLPESSSMAFALMQGLVLRLREADRKIESLALMDVHGRVARALVEAAHADPQGQLLIRERICRQDLAKMVGASREMVSRVMKDLAERGLIEARPDGSTRLLGTLAALG